METVAAPGHFLDGLVSAPAFYDYAIGCAHYARAFDTAVTVHEYGNPILVRDDLQKANDILLGARELLTAASLEHIQVARQVELEKEQLASENVELKERSYRDGLTGLYNRAYFDSNSQFITIKRIVLLNHFHLLF